MDLSERQLYVDGRMKEFVTGQPHEITDRLFVVRRIVRINDALPEEKPDAGRWRWQRAGWLLVDRVSGHVSQVNLPQFDPYSSAQSWYRDYIAYCGVSEDGKKAYAVVAQLGRRKPVLKKLMGDAKGQDMPDSGCPAPVWQRQPRAGDFRILGGPQIHLLATKPCGGSGQQRQRK